MKSIHLGDAQIVLIVIALWILSTLPAYTSPGEAAQQYWARVKQNDPYPIENFEIPQSVTQIIVGIESYLGNLFT